jgi:glycosyltransferase involved in cell wall biosynthesis
MNNPLISILIPCTHTDDGITKTIDSVLSQNYNNFVIKIAAGNKKSYFPEACRVYDDLLDDYSFDEKRISFWGHRASPDVITDGYVKHTLAAMASGKYSMFIEPGDTINIDSISRSIELLQAYSDYSGIMVSHNVSDDHYRAGVDILYRAKEGRFLQCNTHQHGTIWENDMAKKLASDRRLSNLVMDMKYIGADAMYILMQELGGKFLLSGHVGYRRTVRGLDYKCRLEHRMSVLKEMLYLLYHLNHSYQDKLLVTTKKELKKRAITIYKNLMTTSSTYEWSYGDPMTGVKYTSRKILANEKRAYKYIKNEKK